MKIVFKEYSVLDEKESFEILEIRNLDYIRKNMINDEIISLENHLNWIKSLKNNLNKVYFAVIYDDKIVGSCSFVKEKDLSHTWGIYFKSDTNPIISSLSSYLFLEYLFFDLKIEEIYSLVKVENVLAYKFNLNFGFTTYLEDEKFYHLKLNKDHWENSKKNRFLISLKKYLDKIDYKFD